MTYEISVCVNDISDRASATTAALNFAALHNARLTAVYVKLDEVQIRRWAGSSPYSIINNAINEQDILENDAKSSFKAMANTYKCKTTWKTVNQSDDPFKQMICTDFIFASQPIKDEFSHRPDDQFITDLLLQTKRPVIVIPNGWDKPYLGNNILVGWNDSTVAMRAVADAMPLLESADKVSVLKIVKQTLLTPTPRACPDMCSYLAGKGVTNTLLVQGDDRSLGEHEELLNFAKDDGCDLIVIGGYSHSRFREVFFGGVTKYLLTQSSVPVLVSH